MIGGVISSIIVFAVGAILDFAVTASPYQHGFNIHVVGIILMVVGAVGTVLSLVLATMNRTGFRHRETVIEDGQGNVLHRDDRIH
jgi:uncharacterized membrane protein